MAIKSLMAGSLQFRIMGRAPPHDSKLQTAGHQTFNHGLEAWGALIFGKNRTHYNDDESGLASREIKWNE